MSIPLWPIEKNPVTEEQKAKLLARLKPALDNWIRQQKLPQSLWKTIESAHLPLAAWLAEKIDQNGCQVLGIAGGQGTGKSTLSTLLVEILTYGYAKKVLTFSIDDIYLSHAERRQLATDIHPLLATRGVPGTHDPLLGLYLLQQLKVAGKGDLVHLPVFDKAIDDRLPPDQWRVEEGPFDLIIFEGWCVGAMPQTEDELIAPINDLERNEDADGIWRQFVNDELSGPYIDLFAAIDNLLLLKVPGMEQVFEWRLKQENDLKRQRDNDKAATHVMDEAAIRWFIQHYERLTRSMLDEKRGSRTCRKTNAPLARPVMANQPR